MGSTTA